MCLITLCFVRYACVCGGLINSRSVYDLVVGDEGASLWSVLFVYVLLFVGFGVGVSSRPMLRVVGLRVHASILCLHVYVLAWYQAFFSVHVSSRFPWLSGFGLRVVYISVSRCQWRSQCGCSDLPQPVLSL